MLTVSVGFAALSVDVSRFRAAKGELQAIADAAALNGANGLSTNTYVAKAQASATDNKVDNATASIAAADVVPGYWSGTAFTANGTPRNAIRVTAQRTKAAGNSIESIMGRALGWQTPDIVAKSTVALIDQAPYEWSTANSTTIAATSAIRVSAFDATNPGAAETTTTLKSNGSVSVTGPVTVNGNVSYGTSATTTGATITGSTTSNGGTTVYPPGSQVANLSGVTPVYSTTADLTVNTSMSLSGGTYVVKNCTISNCNLTFTGPTTIVVTGNMSWSNCGITTYGNLPANLKIICTVPGTTLSVTNPTLPFYADIYAPDSPMTYSSASGYKGLKGRGVFKTLNASGAGASLYYDRSLTASSLSKKAELVN